MSARSRAAREHLKSLLVASGALAVRFGAAETRRYGEAPALKASSRRAGGSTCVVGCCMRSGVRSDTIARDK